MRKSKMESSTLAALSLAVVLCSIRAQATCVLVDPPPPKAVCGVRGKGPGSSLLYGYQNPSITNTWKECMTLCLGRIYYGYANCPAFYFNSTSNLCHFSGKLQPDNIIKDKSSDTVFYNRNCFDCTVQKCPAPKGPNGHGNEIANGGFENSDTYIGPWNGDYYSSYMTFHPTKPGINSPQEFLCKDTMIEQSYRSCPGQTHRLDFDAANTEAIRINRPNVFIFEDLPPGRNPVKEFLSGSMVWTPGDGEIAGKPRNESFFYNAQFRYNSIAVGCLGESGKEKVTMTVDNFRVRPVDMSSLKVLGEKVINGDFETGKLGPTEVKHPGKKKVSIISPGLKGSKHALKVGPIEGFEKVIIRPKINTAALGKGRRLYRLSINVDFNQTELIYQIGRVYKHDRKTPREIEIEGSAADFGYFYAGKDDFPIWITLRTKQDHGPLTIDNISVRELQEE